MAPVRRSALVRDLRPEISRAEKAMELHHTRLKGHLRGYFEKRTAEERVPTITHVESAYIREILTYFEQCISATEDVTREYIDE